jgi:galactose mutarotase-like enzyme
VTDTPPARRAAGQDDRPRGARVHRTLLIENDLVSALVAVDRGADLVSLVYRPRNVDVLWKAPGPQLDLVGMEPTVARWHSGYPGGWQTILPNFGPPNHHDGRWLGMHGEAACIPWTVDEIAQTGPVASIAMSAVLRSVPLRVARTLSVRAGEPFIRIVETVTNRADRPTDLMWGHHPAFGAPFLSPHCAIDTGARTVEPDPGHRSDTCDLVAGTRTTWPWAIAKDGRAVNLSRPPPPGLGVSRVVTLSGFTEPWFAITNEELGFGVGLAWTADPFRYACLWQDSDGSAHEPLGGGAYVLAIEPHSSHPGHGLAEVVRTTGTHLTLRPFEQRRADLCVVFYDGPSRVDHVGRDGMVTRS